MVKRRQQFMLPHHPAHHNSTHDSNTIQYSSNLLIQTTIQAKQNTSSTGSQIDFQIVLNTRYELNSLISAIPPTSSRAYPANFDHHISTMRTTEFYPSPTSNHTISSYVVGKSFRRSVQSNPIQSPALTFHFQTCPC